MTYDQKGLTQSITASSSRKYISRHYLSLMSYLRENHPNKEDHHNVINLIYHKFPDEGKKLIENHDISDREKKDLLIKFLIYSPQIVCGIMGDQRMGKDGLICKVFQECITYCE